MKDRLPYDTDSRLVSAADKRAIRRMVRARGARVVGAGVWKYISLGEGLGPCFPFTLDGAAAMLAYKF